VWLVPCRYALSAAVSERMSHRDDDILPKFSADSSSVCYLCH